MPSRRYRKKLRANEISNTRKFIETPLTISSGNITNEGDNYGNVDELTMLEDYFINLIEMVTVFNNFTLFNRLLLDVKDYLEPSIYYNQIIENIENGFLSLIENVSTNVNHTLITCRIEYIKKNILALPPGLEDYNINISNMILDVISLITQNLNFNSIKTNLENIKISTVNEYGNFILVKEIHDLLLDIIGNIELCTPPHLIKLRVDYVKELVTKL
jgi:hypothetical protein